MNSGLTTSHEERWNDMKKRLVVVGSINVDLVSVAPRFRYRRNLTATSFGTFPAGKAPIRPSRPPALVTE